MIRRLAAAVFALAFAGAASAAKPQVFVLGTLYKKHDTIASYDLAALARVVEAIRPDVVVLDVTPTELAERKVFPSKIEYTQVIFPYIDERKIKAYAGEPSEPLFGEVVKKAIAIRDDLKRSNPDGAAAMEAYRKATYAALAAWWRDPADANGALSERVVKGLKSYEAGLLGAAEEEGSRRWDGHAAGVLLTAAGENPGKRILHVAGIENLPNLRAELRGRKEIDLVDMEAWIRAEVPARAAPEKPAG